MGTNSKNRDKRASSHKKPKNTPTAEIGMKFGEELVRMIAGAAGRDIRDVADDQRLEKDLKLDSLDVAGLILEIEKRFNVIIPVDEIRKIKTVYDLIAIAEYHILFNRGTD